MDRLRLADMLGEAFGPRGAHTADLLAAAVGAGAPPPVIARLRELPEGPYRSMAELWGHLPEYAGE